MEQWIHNEILDGLSKLLCLGLERTPAADMIAGTAMAWVQAVTHERVFDRELDTPRFRRAFILLSATRTTWPAPLHFMEAMPKREQLALTRQHVPADPERAQAAISEIASVLSGKSAAAGPDA